MAESTSDPFQCLAVASPHTSRVTLGTSVALAFPRSAMLTAVAAWDLQRATHGWHILGLGSQVRRHIERRFSAPFTPPAARLREYAQAVRHVWGAFQGEHDGRPGHRAGSFGAALSPNVPEAWLTQAAAYLLGTTYTGLHPLGSLSDHAHICDDAGIAALVVHPTFAETGARLAERCPGIGCLLTLGPAEVGEDLLALAENTPAGRLSRGPAGAEDTAWLQYTGGTTGTPKGVMVPHRALVAQTQTLTCSWGLPETPRPARPPITHAGSLPILPTLCRTGPSCCSGSSTRRRGWTR